MDNVIILDENKRAVSTKRKILNYAILVLSLVSLVQLIPVLIDNFGFNAILSIFLSFVGLAAFWATHQQKKNARSLTLLWIIPQLIIFINYPYFSFDLTQGYSFPLGMKFWSSENGTITRLFNLSFNFLPLVYLWLLRDKR
jgi:hypothetical protein